MGIGHLFGRAVGLLPTSTRHRRTTRASRLRRETAISAEFVDDTERRIPDSLRPGVGSETTDVMMPERSPKDSPLLGHLSLKCSAPGWGLILRAWRSAPWPDSNSTTTSRSRPLVNAGVIGLVSLVPAANAEERV